MKASHIPAVAALAALLLVALTSACRDATTPEAPTAAPAPEGAVTVARTFTLTLLPLPAGAQRMSPAAIAKTAATDIVVGTVDIGGAYRAFRWTPAGGARVLPVPTNFAECWAASVNKHAVAVGTCRDVNGPRAVVWAPGKSPRVLGPLPPYRDGTGTAVNDSGVVVGYTATIDTARQRRMFVGWRWTAAAGMQELPHYTDPASGCDVFTGAPIAVNNAGWILTSRLHGMDLPSSWDPCGWPRGDALLYSPDLTPRVAAGGADTVWLSANALNNQADPAYVYLATHLFVARASGSTPCAATQGRLLTPRGGAVYAQQFGINDKRQVVAWDNIWDANCNPSKLPRPAGVTTGTGSLDAVAINNLGHAVGVARMTDGTVRSVLWK